jgi:hypothetical protein
MHFFWVKHSFKGYSYARLSGQSCEHNCWYKQTHLNTGKEYFINYQHTISVNRAYVIQTAKVCSRVGIHS